VAVVEVVVVVVDVVAVVEVEVVMAHTARSEEDRDTLWDAWGPWSECSRTCGGGASYSLRRCLSSKTCEGQNIKYRTCSNVDCPPEAGDFRAQQCSAHADVRYQGQYHEWLPVDNDPDNPCALKCRAQGSGLLVELAPKVLDGTRCYTESLDMCISGACQIVGCDHELGSAAKEDNCGVCNGDGSSCRLVRGHYKSQHASGKTEDTVVVIPYRSRHVRLVLKDIESKTLQGVKGELSLEASGQHHLENTTLEYQKHSDKAVLRIAGPLGADFTVKVQYASSATADSVVQFIYYQPIIHRWRETDFFPCSVTCGGGYQLTSAECFDQRVGRVVVDQYCHYYPENVKPKPKLRECNMDPCLASDGYKQIMPYDLYHPLPRWESSPWTACSMSCGGGVQSRAVSCVEEDMQGTLTAAEEWKCLYTPKTAIVQPCNAFHCPTWLAQDWSPCTVTCGQGLRYRVVLCIDHRGLHARGCSPPTKPHIKEECLPCSSSCGSGTQRRGVQCQVLLSFSQAVAELPLDECQGPKPPGSRPCYRAPCPGGVGPQGGTEAEGDEEEEAREELHDWEYDGFSDACSATCGVGLMTRAVACTLRPARGSNHTRALRDQECPPTKPGPVQACNRFDCPPLWDTREWGKCSQSCGGGGVQRREVACKQHLADGSALALPDTFCPSLVPAGQQPLRQAGLSSPCSVSCGKGVQRVETECAMQGQDGRIRTLSLDACAALPPPTSSNRLELAKPDPTILAQSKVYVQLRKAKRLQFVVGGYAYLLPWTSVVLRCPTRRFRKAHVRWLKEGRPLARLPHLSLGLASPGHLKIQQLHASHVGVYTCVAGKAQESFVLKIIGGKQKLSWPAGAGREPGKTDGPDALLPPDHAQELRDAFGRYDEAVRRLLALKASGAQQEEEEEERAVGAAPPHSSQRNGSVTTPDDDLAGADPPLLLIAETEKLDAVLQRLSEGPGGPWEEPAVTRLLGELLAAQADANESTLHPPERAEASATPGPPPLLDGPDGGPRAPVIVQRPRKVGVAAASEVTVPVGTPVRLQRPVASVELRCEAMGHPTPTSCAKCYRSGGKSEFKQSGP
ncbi:hypothetical protein CRUP_014540, partial [Coryphaenoides rupestris]